MINLGFRLLFFVFLSTKKSPSCYLLNVFTSALSGNFPLTLFPSPLSLPSTPHCPLSALTLSVTFPLKVMPWKDTMTMIHVDLMASGGVWLRDMKLKSQVTRCPELFWGRFGRGNQAWRRNDWCGISLAFCGRMTCFLYQCFSCYPSKHSVM